MGKYTAIFVFNLDFSFSSQMWTERTKEKRCERMNEIAFYQWTKWKMNEVSNKKKQIAPAFKRNEIFLFDNKWAAWFFGLICHLCVLNECIINSIALKIFKLQMFRNDHIASFPLSPSSMLFMSSRHFFSSLRLHAFFLLNGYQMHLYGDFLATETCYNSSFVEEIEKCVQNYLIVLLWTFYSIDFYCFLTRPFAITRTYTILLNHSFSLF